MICRITNNPGEVLGDNVLVCLKIGAGRPTGSCDVGLRNVSPTRENPSACGH